MSNVQPINTAPPLYLVLTTTVGSYRVLLTPEQFNDLLVNAVWLDLEWNSTARENDLVEIDPLVPARNQINPQVMSAATLDAIRVAKRLKENTPS